MQLRNGHVHAASQNTALARNTSTPTTTATFRAGFTSGLHAAAPWYASTASSTLSACWVQTVQRGGGLMGDGWGFQLGQFPGK